MTRSTKACLATTHYNSRTVECDNCGHIGRGLPEMCDCCAGPKARGNDKREHKAAREENRR